MFQNVICGFDDQSLVISNRQMGLMDESSELSSFPVGDRMWLLPLRMETDFKKFHVFWLDVVINCLYTNAMLSGFERKRKTYIEQLIHAYHCKCFCIVDGYAQIDH